MTWQIVFTTNESFRPRRNSQAFKSLHGKNTKHDLYNRDLYYSHPLHFRKSAVNPVYCRFTKRYSFHGIKKPPNRINPCGGVQLAISVWKKPVGEWVVNRSYSWRE